ncbi:2-succinyl-5-enolpyruvyl-6-hydroxy-3-cyclohexene-1-carboxylic-acid synthase [Bacteroidota bacterium]
MTKLPFKQQVADLAKIFKQQNIRHIVLCPGSRNAPLIQVFERDESFVCHSIVDERSAGYVALGMAKQLRELTAVVTTSGTAALNLAPAVAEAFNQEIALVVITADRPEEWPPQFTNQRIIQPGIFSQNCKHTCIIPPSSVGPEILNESLQKVARFIADASQAKKGPVHINITLEEPLYETISSPSSSDYKVVEQEEETIDYNEKVVQTIKSALNFRKKVLIIAGMSFYTEEEKVMLDTLIYGYEVSIIAENLCNLKNNKLVTAPELVLARADKNQKQQIKPDLIITFGGQVVSKRIRLFVQDYNDIPIAAFKQFPLALFKQICNEASLEQADNAYVKMWKDIEKDAWQKATTYLSKAPFSNLTALQRILDLLPQNSILHLGNSGTIRYSQLRPMRSDLSYYANRGTSGIDGSVSTAAGAAMVSDQLHFLILGDLSFVYDSNGLWNRNFPKNLTIIVLNDNGGGIFRLLDGPDRMPFFEAYAVAYHPVSLKHLGEAFGMTCLKANDYQTLSKAFDELLTLDNQPVLLEIETYESENSSIFKALFTSLGDS